MILLLEARKTDGVSAWHYAIGRQNSFRMDVTCDGQTVWSGEQLSPPFKNVRDPSKAYFFLGLR